MTTARLTRSATTTASIEVLGTLNCRASDGRATFTIVESIMLMNMATTKTTLTLTLGSSRTRCMDTLQRHNERKRRMLPTIHPWNECHSNIDSIYDILFVTTYPTPCQSIFKESNHVPLFCRQ